MDGCANAAPTLAGHPLERKEHSLSASRGQTGLGAGLAPPSCVWSIAEPRLVHALGRAPRRRKWMAAPNTWHPVRTQNSPLGPHFHVWKRRPARALPHQTPPLSTALEKGGGDPSKIRPALLLIKSGLPQPRAPAANDTMTLCHPHPHPRVPTRLQPLLPGSGGGNGTRGRLRHTSALPLLSLASGCTKEPGGPCSRSRTFHTC